MESFRHQLRKWPGGQTVWPMMSTPRFLPSKKAEENPSILYRAKASMRMFAWCQTWRRRQHGMLYEGSTSLVCGIPRWKSILQEDTGAMRQWCREAGIASKSNVTWQVSSLQGHCHQVQAAGLGRAIEIGPDLHWHNVFLRGA